MDTNKDIEELTPAERWIIAVTVMFGAFMAVMDISVVNVSMPFMMGTFGEDLSAITWVATSYSIAEIIMVTMTGWWSALIGRKRLFLASYALFTLGSILCGTSTTFTQMIIYRVIQGIGGGALIPLSQAILRETFPEEQQSMAMAMYGMGVVLAPAVGPILGGWLTDSYGWEWIFYINVPVCALGMALAIRYIHDPAYLRRGVKSIDWQGIALLTLCLTAMQIVLERGQEKNWFESDQIIVGTAIAVVSLLVLIIWELRVQEPVVNLRVLKDRNLSLGSFIGLLFGIALFGTTFILPQFTQQLLGYPALQAGLVLAPRGLTLLMFMPIAGWLFNRLGFRTLILLGLGIITWSYYDLMQLNLNAGFWNLVPSLLIMGAGMPFVFVPLSTVSLSTVDRSNMTDASGIFTLTRRIGGNIGYAMAATLVSHGEQMHRFHMASHVSNLSQITQSYMDTATAMVHQLGVSATAAPTVALGLMNRLLNRQAIMMSYNDTSLYFGLLFIVMAPIVFLLPDQSGWLKRLRRR
ncbi:DHA2 family efflux MFS transporter permease subunit [Desulfovibrio inopinatus]|uniref:DHA2 family efflux MFS transporter permease subunit n=1 Tax=Desulfovibrio inopinatus TaxID=102109 RepID=UPI0004205ABE|nr:DHA2 family efflux MFS transporter permease subunit [Desulfovibrio inopinatus]